MPTCLIVGAGLAGLTAGRHLQSHGWNVTLLDKGRTVGGRMATRSFSGATFDHGAQFFTTRDPRFTAEVQHWIEAGIAREWFDSEDGHTRYCGTKGMGSIAEYLAQPLDARPSEHVESISRDGLWQVQTRTARYYADALILTPPVEQSLALVNLPDAPFANIQYEPCFCAMAILAEPSKIPSPGYLRPGSGPISWIADNQQKGISALPALTIHATPEFTRRHWDTDKSEVANLLLEAAGYTAIETRLHRWKYSNLSSTSPESCFRQNSLLLAGDAFAGPRIEGAYLSGLTAASNLVSNPPASTNS